MIEEIRPRAVICLGLWPGGPMLRIERIAVNIADFEIADNAGLNAKAQVVEGGPAGLLETLPIETSGTGCSRAGIPARLSGTAGQFLCNALIYHALRFCALRVPPPRCGLIHLPHLPGQVAAAGAGARSRDRRGPAASRPRLDGDRDHGRGRAPRDPDHARGRQLIAR